MLDKEVDRHGFHLSRDELAATVKSSMPVLSLMEFDDLLAGLGSGEVRINQLMNFLEQKLNKPTAEEEDRRLREQLENKTQHRMKKC